MIRQTSLYAILLITLLALTCCVAPTRNLQSVGSQVIVELPEEPETRIILGFGDVVLRIPLGTSLDKWYTSAGVLDQLPELREVVGKTPLERVQSILDILNKKVHYISDKTNEYRTPAQTLQNGGGDCEDLAILVGVLIRMDGYKGRIYTGFGLKMDPAGENHGHAWCMLPDEVSLVDCVGPAGNELSLLIGVVEEVAEVLGYTLMQTYAIP